MKHKKNQEEIDKKHRRDFANEVEIPNDKINVKNEQLRKKMLRRDEIRQDGVNMNKTKKEFDYYSKFMHSGIDSGNNANLVKKYMKMNYNDWPAHSIFSSKTNYISKQSQLLFYLLFQIIYKYLKINIKYILLHFVFWW